MKNISTVLCLLLLATHGSHAQMQKEYTSNQIYKKIQKLNFLGTVLYVGAHPDDENTAMISYFSNHTNARVGYLAMNRGDGGQNLIGTEIRELLGVIRTEELLAARGIDGGEQFFTRANDFGFSKNPEETFRFWNRDQVLSDVVWNFRKFRPDVIINRFNHRTEGDTHGHHTASAILSVEAFDLAGDKKEFPDQLQYVEPWQPKRLYFNDSWFFYGSKEAYQKADHTGFVKLDMGTYLPILGESNTEISALSRSQHRSQGFGVPSERGTDFSYLEAIKGDFTRTDADVFSGIDTSWNRIPGGKEIGKILEKVQKDFDFTQPEKSLPGLLQAYQRIQELKDPYWRTLKTEQIKEIIGAAAGLYLEAFTDQEYGTLGASLPVNLEAINRSGAQVVLKAVRMTPSETNLLTAEKNLAPNQDLKLQNPLMISSQLNYSDPYWLRAPHTDGMYTVADQKLIGLPETPPQLVAVFDLTINGVPVSFERELIYKGSTQILGEIKEPFAIVPDASVNIKDKVLVFANDEAKKMAVEVTAFRDALTGTLSLKHPADWQVNPTEIPLSFKNKGESHLVEFTVTPPREQVSAEISALFRENGKSFDQYVYKIDYPHIPTQIVLQPAKAKVNRLDIKIAGKNIGYIPGAGDEIPQGLQEIGYHVTMLDSGNLTAENLKKYDAIVLGIRIYNLDDQLILNQKTLFDYVKNGGTLVTQYSQMMGLKTQKLTPFDFTPSALRVTDENAAVKFLAPNHPVLNEPNKITPADFEGWVQERGLYFPSSFGKEFTPILAMHDPGEKDLDGSLLVAPYGKGYFVYTGLSFFRQLPAGVPGAYRLFANILALGNEEK